MKNRTILNQLIIKAPDRRVFDVGTWRTNMRSADIGRPAPLFDMFDDLALDGILYDAVDKRISAITNSELTFLDKKGRQVPAIEELIDTVGFDELLKILGMSIFNGRAGLEYDFSGEFSVRAIPAKHISLEKQVILLNQTDDDGIPYEKDSNILITGKPRDYGIFLKTAPLVIWKRGGFGDYAQWLELFAMPQRIGKYNNYDPQARQLLLEALKEAGSAPYAVIPKESEIETVNNTGNGSSGSSYNEFRQACNEELLITVLGQTLTTTAGEKGARSLGEVHMQVEEAKNKSDIRFVQRMLNSRVLPVLESRGYPVAGGKFVFPKQAESLSVTEILSLTKIIDIPAAWLYDKYSIPEPDGTEKIAGKDIQDPEGEPNPDPKPNPDPEPEKDTEKLKLFDRILNFFVKAPASMAGAYRKHTGKLADIITGTINLADSGEKPLKIDIVRLFNKAVRDVYDIEIQGREQPEISRSLFEITNSALQRGIDREFRAAGMEFGTRNRAFTEEFKYNASIFAAFKNHKQTQEIVNLLRNEKGDLRSFSDFKKRALKVSKDYNEAWLKTEYNTAVRAARQAVLFKQAEQAERMYPNLEYVESSAEHPREKHEEWVGTILSLYHPWWEDHFPPSDWNCQCSVRQTDKPTTPVPADNGGNPVFRNNPGKTARFVNLREHPYAKGLCPWVDDCSRQRISLADRPFRKECNICLLAKTWRLNRDRIAQNRADWETFRHDKNFTGVKFNEKTGGLLAIHKKHKFDATTGIFNIPRGDYEKNAAQVLYKYGRSVILSSEVSLVEGAKTPDGILDGKSFDIKAVEAMGKYTIRNKLRSAQAQGVNSVVLYYHNADVFSLTLLKEGYQHYARDAEDPIENIYYIVGRKLFRFK